MLASVGPEGALSEVGSPMSATGVVSAAGSLSLEDEQAPRTIDTVAMLATAIRARTRFISASMEIE